MKDQLLLNIFVAITFLNSCWLIISFYRFHTLKQKLRTYRRKSNKKFEDNYFRILSTDKNNLRLDNDIKVIAEAIFRLKNNSIPEDKDTDEEIMNYLNIGYIDLLEMMRNEKEYANNRSSAIERLGNGVS